MPERRAWLVRGRVQGVGFRWWTVRAAVRHALAGTVRNRLDGTVEVMCIGDPPAIESFEGELHRGPVMASVDALESIECTLPSGLSGFTILE